MNVTTEEKDNVAELFHVKFCTHVMNKISQMWSMPKVSTCRMSCGPHNKYLVFEKCCEKWCSSGFLVTKNVQMS